LLEDAVSGAEDIGSHEVLADALCERSLAAVARHQWDRAEALASRARSVMHRAGIEDIYTTPLVCTVQARVALHRGDLPTVHRELVTAQRLRPLLTYAHPYLAIQARIEMIRIHLALSDLAGARTLMQEVDDLLKRRPGLGTLVGEAEALRARLAHERGASVPGASALTAAELRLLPMLCTHLSFPEIAVPTCRFPRSPQNCSSRPTPPRRTRSRSTGSSMPAPAARRSPGPVSSGCWKADEAASARTIPDGSPGRSEPHANRMRRNPVGCDFVGVRVKCPPSAGLGGPADSPDA
jgi:hypothetical protein